MPTALKIAENGALTTNAYALPINPIQPRRMVKNQPAKRFATLTGVGGIQAPKDYFSEIIFTWPTLVKSNTDHAALLAAFEARQYVKTGINYFIGIVAGDSKDAGFPFWNTAKYIEIRIIEVMSAERPIENDLDEVLFDMAVTALWVDPD